MNKIKEDDFKKILAFYKEDLEFLKHKKMLITGACGMINTYLTEFLIYIAESYCLELYLQCRNKEKAEQIYGEYLHKDYIHIETFDLADGVIPDVQFDYIIHGASPAGTKMFMESPVDVISPNVLGTWNLLHYAKKTGVYKFLLLSSSSIYGEGGTNKNVLTETDYGIVDPLNERASYIEAKRLAEQMCMAYWRQYNVPAGIIRICHTYGPTFDIQNDTRIIPRVMKKILSGEDITIYKDPDSVIQYTYIADMIAAILLVLIKGECGQAYNAGGDEIVKMEDVISWMVHADKSIKSTLYRKEMDENYNFRKGKGVNFLKLSNDKLCKLGWQQLFRNEEGFSRIVRSYMEDKSNSIIYRKY